MQLLVVARFVTAFGIGSLAGCCHAPAPSASNPAPLIAVREEVSRSPTFPLPLEQASRQSLLMFLAAGGNNDGIEEGALVTVVYPDAEQRWAELLELLSRPTNVELTAVSSPTFARWFKNPPIRQVVDARAARPNLACPPLAFTHERFVWVFECKDSKTLGSVFVQQAIAARAQ
jgi:hypothetical protein